MLTKSSQRKLCQKCERAGTFHKTYSKVHIYRNLSTLYFTPNTCGGKSDNSDLRYSTFRVCNILFAASDSYCPCVCLSGKCMWVFVFVCVCVCVCVCVGVCGEWGVWGGVCACECVCACDCAL